MPISLEEYKNLEENKSGRTGGRRINWDATLARLQKCEDALTVKDIKELILAMKYADSVSMVRVSNWCKDQVKKGLATAKTDGKRLYYYFYKEAD